MLNFILQPTPLSSLYKISKMTNLKVACFDQYQFSSVRFAGIVRDLTIKTTIKTVALRLSLFHTNPLTRAQNYYINNTKNIRVNLRLVTKN